MRAAGKPAAAYFRIPPGGVPSQRSTPYRLRTSAANTSIRRRLTVGTALPVTALPGPARAISARRAAPAGRPGAPGRARREVGAKQVT